MRDSSTHQKKRVVDMMTNLMKDLADIGSSIGSEFKVYPSSSSSTAAVAAEAALSSLQQCKCKQLAMCSLCLMCDNYFRVVLDLLFPNLAEPDFAGF